MKDVIFVKYHKDVFFQMQVGAATVFWVNNDIYVLVDLSFLVSKWAKVEATLLQLSVCVCVATRHILIDESPNQQF